MRHRRGVTVSLLIILVGLLTWTGVAWYEKQRVRQITQQVLERVYVRAVRDYYELVNDVWRELASDGDTHARHFSPLWKYSVTGLDMPTGETAEWRVRISLEEMNGVASAPMTEVPGDGVWLRFVRGKQSFDLYLELSDWLGELTRDAGLGEVRTHIVSMVGVEDGDGIVFRDFLLPSLGLRFDSLRVEQGMLSLMIPSAASAVAMLIAALLSSLWHLWRHKEEEVLSEKIHSAEQLATLGEMAAGIAHEINNPLAYIDSNLSGLADDIEALNEFVRILDRASDHLDIRNPFYQQALSGYQRLNIALVCENAPVRVRDCLGGLQRIEQIINDMRTLSQGASDPQTLADFNADLPAVFHIIESRLPEGVTLETTLVDTGLVICNPAQVAQVVMNMLVNALHALEGRSGVIRVQQVLEADILQMSITDSGCGMAPDVMSRIFEPFFTTREKGKGTGIGLALCYKLIKEHNGEIAVRSQPGIGTTFSLTIPLRRGDSDNAQ